MPQALFPDARFRSPTAVEGKADIRDENVYSAVRLHHGGTGSAKMFTVPNGQAIPGLAGSGITSPPTSAGTAHQVTHTDQTTNLAKAGEVGSAIGDISIRALGLIVEQAGYTPGTGVIRGWGAGQLEISDVLSRVSFELKVGGKRQIIGPVFTFPTVGGMVGAISTSGNAATASMATNGMPGTLRRLKYPILVARTDALEGVVTVAGTSSLVFGTTTGEGQPTLLWASLLCSVSWIMKMILGFVRSFGRGFPQPVAA